MAQLLLLALVLVTAWTFKRHYSLLTPSQQAAWKKKLPLVVVLAIVLVLTLAGRLHWLGLALAAVLFAVKGLVTAVIRGWPLWRMYRKLRGGKDISRLETASLRMVFDLERGHLDGEVLAGPFEGWALSSLSRQQLDELMAWLKEREKESRLLLHAYLLRRFHGGEREADESASQFAATSASVTEQEAWQILGLKPGASQEEIIKAHRALIQKLHPDRGGNDYLAAKVNAAKDHLLG